MVDTGVLCECSGNLVAIWAKDLSDGAVEHIVHQVDLPAGTKQLLCLRLLLCQHKGQEQSEKNAGLHGFCLAGFFQGIRCKLPNEWRRNQLPAVLPFISG